MKKQLAMFALSLFLLPACAKSSAYRIEAAPDFDSSSAVLPASGKLIYLSPFKDNRPDREIFKGRAKYDQILIETAGNSQLAKSWQDLKVGDISYLFHRQLAYELGASGYRVMAAAEPETLEISMAHALSAGAKVLLRGRVRQFKMGRKGADPIFGTSFNGTLYPLTFEAYPEIYDVIGNTLVWSQKVTYKKEYYNSKRLGAYNAETFPQYFVRGLPEAVHEIAAHAELRAVAGLPALTPTPTVTATAEAARPVAPAKGETAIPTPTLTATPEMEYWVCPKDAKRMDPAWEICPFDGTKRKEFILKVNRNLKK